MPDADGRLETGVSIVLRDAPAALEWVHRELHPVHAARSIPLHITLLYPFVPRSSLTRAHEDRLMGLFREQEPFDLDLVSVDAFPEVVYAVPSPDERLRVLMRAVWNAFPETPPYGGAFEDPAPHATLALVPEGESPDRAAERIRKLVADVLPLRFVARDVSLLEEYEADRWREACAFRLGA